MRSELFVLASSLVAKQEPFALATVVRRQAASSAQAGDGALITADGTFHGWLGGSCTQPTVVREALKAIADGAPRLIALAPDPRTEQRPGILVFPMTCHSGGSVDIYIEPVLPPARLLVFGVSPAAQALARLGRAMGFAVDVADPAADHAAFPPEVVERVWTDPEGPKPSAFPGSRPFAVVATMGERDEAAVRAALSVDPAYLGVVASRKRFAEIEAALVAGGVARESLAAIRSPAGLDIGARAPEEIAVSILAEIVRVRRTAVEPAIAPARPAGLPVAAAAAEGEERDPVCGMMVGVEGARHTAELAGRTWYFCCGGCREKFLASPGGFTQTAGAGA